MSWAVTCNSIDFARTLSALGAKADLFCAAGIGAVEDIRAAFDDAGRLRPGASRTGSSRSGTDGNRLPCPPETVRDQISDALYIASRNGQLDSVRELLEHEPDLGFKAYDGATALHWAYFSGARDVVTALIAAGADTARHDNRINASPQAFGICTAASWGFGWLVKRLLASDPDLIQQKTADGRTPADLARAGGHAALAEELDKLKPS
jgi:ankyrin repeat protein